KTAFLHGELEEQIYMKQPEGFEVQGKEDHVCLLKKSLYGLKQSSRQWYRRFDTFMLENGYCRSEHDSCVYYKKLANKSFIYLLLYVDDMLIACKNMSEIKSLKAQLSSEFEMKDLGAGRKILGMEIQRDRKEGTLFLSQKKYIEKVLERFGMQNAKPVTTPLASHFKLSMALCPQTESENEEMSSVPYASAVGSLMYAMICTRPDIAQAVSVVSRYMASPGKVHWKAVKWIMRYLKGTMDIGLLYGKVKGVGSKVIGYVDSDYAGDLDKRRSLTGYVFTLCGCTVSWKATLQSIVALSTTEAEYIAVTEAVKEAIWEKGLIEELGIQLEETTIYCDSQSAIHLTKNPMYHERTKHIDKTAFLHGELEEQIYMKQPEGFEVQGKEDHVCLLKKSLYGLKQSSRQWYRRFDTFMLENGYCRSEHDSCVYYKKLANKSFIYLLLYVDDMLIACKNMSEIKSLKAQLSSEFEMKDLGAGRKILGMEIQRDRKEGTLFLSQKKYIEKVLERFGMQNAKPVTTPLASHFKLSMALCPQTESENEEMSSVPYASAVGSLMYAMICTRPDIAQAVSVVSRYMASPGKVHWKAVKWIMRYLKGTMDIGLLYGKVKGVGSKVIGYVDSDYAGDLDKRRSLTGYVFTLCGCTVSWKATLQSIVALSTTEAEYIAVTEAVKEAIWEKGLIEELGIQLEETTIYCDSQSAIHLTKNPMYHERTKHIDKTAFLHGELEEQIYMKQPEGFEVQGKEDHVCLLKKSLYGLKQSSRQWYRRFDTFMLENGYCRSEHDSCVYYKKLANKSFIYLLLYVDDMLIACKNMSEIKSLKAQLSSEFEMKDLGAGRKILGMEIQRDRKEGTLFLSQKKYIEKVLERFGMQNAKPVTTPLASHFKLSMALCPQTESENEEMSSVPYASAVGSLMYAMICTRPDIAQAVSVVSRYMASPGKVHWKAVKWIMRYLKGTMDIGLLYGKVKGVGSKVIGYVDSDYAGDLDKRRSLTGYVFTLCGCTVSWKATLQSIVALSTTEAEYIAVTEAVKEAIWEKGLIEELGIQLEETTIYCDSQSAIHLTKNPMYHERTKHIDLFCPMFQQFGCISAPLDSVMSQLQMGNIESA
ncbi:PREDICTED: uncharacterized protein LOC109342419, partial [Lupinus angustifolius]|uniref:uncharacterized protein LOC109342419 n=1 Tax=Lupinus angustifolius TaxID=3871 RepID=UPI00092EA0BB